MFGGDGMDPQKMKQTIKQMGIDVTELDTEGVIIKADDDELVFSGTQVTRMDAQGQETYQTIDEPETREFGAGDDDDGFVEFAESVGAVDAILTDDVAIVTQRAGVPEDKAHEALEAEDDDLTAAIAQLE